MDSASAGSSQDRLGERRRNRNGPTSAPSPRTANIRPSPRAPTGKTPAASSGNDGQHAVAQADRGLDGDQRQQPRLAPQVAHRLPDRGEGRAGAVGDRFLHRPADPPGQQRRGHQADRDDAEAGVRAEPAR